MKSGYFRQGVFAATVSRNNINRTAQAESSPWPRRGLGNAHLSWVQSCLARVKGTHSALESRCRKASGGGFHSGGHEHSAKASLAVVSFAENLKRVLLCREVWKRLSPLPRDLAALPDLFPSTHSLTPPSNRLPPNEPYIKQSQTLVWTTDPSQRQGWGGEGGDWGRISFGTWGKIWAKIVTVVSNPVD